MKYRLSWHYTPYWQVAERLNKPGIYWVLEFVYVSYQATSSSWLIAVPGWQESFKLRNYHYADGLLSEVQPSLRCSNLKVVPVPKQVVDEQRLPGNKINRLMALFSWLRGLFGQPNGACSVLHYTIPAALVKEYQQAPGAANTSMLSASPILQCCWKPAIYCWLENVQYVILIRSESLRRVRNPLCQPAAIISPERPLRFDR